MHDQIRLVSKSRPDEVSARLSEEDTRLVHLYWNTPPAERDTALLGKVGPILRHAIERKCWFRCNCGTGAMMYPSEIKAEGVVRLTRMSNYPLHATGCSFSWEEGELGRHPKPSLADNQPRKLPSKPDFVLYRASSPRAAAGGEAGDNHSSTVRRARQSKLQTLMFWLLRESGYDYLLSPKAPPYQRVKAVAETVEVAPGVKLSGVLWFTGRAIAEGWAKDRLKKLAGSDLWPKNWPAQGYLMLIVRSFSKQGMRVVRSDGVSLTLDGSIEVFGRGGASAEPYLALVSLRLEDGRLKFISAYLHPVLSATEWVPVDSGYERDAAQAICQFLAATTAQGAAYRVQKPLEDYEVANQGCRPDFVVTAGDGKCLVVETMGSDEPEYRAGKLRTHVLMAELGRIAIDERAAVKKEAADEALKKKLWRWHYDLQRKNEKQ